MKSVALLIIAAALSVTGIALADDETKTTRAEPKVVVKKEIRIKPTCPTTPRGITFYRGKTWGHEDTLGISRSKAERKAWEYPCDYGEWVRKLWKERSHTRAKQVENMPPPIPVGEFQIRRYLLTVMSPSEAECAGYIIDPETAGTWSPTISNYAGSGAYGLPQALPGYKMSSAGDDWATNPITQIKWMIGYVNSRYGGMCAAYSFRRSNGWY